MSKIVQANQGFQVNEFNNKYAFIYHQIKYSFLQLWPFIFMFTFVVALPLAVSFDPYNVMKPWIAMSVAGAFLIKYTVNYFRKDGTFKLDSRGIEIEGSVYQYQDVRTIHIKQGDQDQSFKMEAYSGPTYVASSSSGILAASSLNAANSAGNILGNLVFYQGKRNKRINCKVYFQYGNKQINLAKGITSETAGLMVDKIGEIQAKFK